MHCFVVNLEHSRCSWVIGFSCDPGVVTVLLRGNRLVSKSVWLGGLFGCFASVVFSCISLTGLIIMILSIIVLMFVVSLQVHSMYWPGVSCQISRKSRWNGVLSESRSCPHRCPCAMEFHFVVVPLPLSYHDRGPSCSLNNVYIVQSHRVCRLASLPDVISNLCFY